MTLLCKCPIVYNAAMRLEYNNYLNRLSINPVAGAKFAAKNWDLMVVAYSGTEPLFSGTEPLIL